MRYELLAPYGSRFSVYSSKELKLGTLALCESEGIGGVIVSISNYGIPPPDEDLLVSYTEPPKKEVVTELGTYFEFQDCIAQGSDNALWVRWQGGWVFKGSERLIVTFTPDIEAQMREAFVEWVFSKAEQ